MNDLMREIEEALARTRAAMDEAVRVMHAADARIALLEQENARLQREIEKMRLIAGGAWRRRGEA